MIKERRLKKNSKNKMIKKLIIKKVMPKKKKLNWNFVKIMNVITFLQIKKIVFSNML